MLFEKLLPTFSISSFCLQFQTEGGDKVVSKQNEKEKYETTTAEKEDIGTYQGVTFLAVLTP